jgi:uncharacterized LabA/DUF88 family protein
MDGDTYLFIDGGYLRDVFRSAMREVFENAGEMDLGHVREDAGALKAFYYDCLNDVKLPPESEPEFDTRVKAQQRLFSTIRSLKGFHVQLGTLKGGHKRREQKEVDVLLAVDMLTHAFNRNMTRAVLIAGDLDFRPIIEALVRLGVFVEVWYEKKSASQDLYHAADYAQEFLWIQLYNWGNTKFKSENLLPRQDVAHGPVYEATLLHSGLIDKTYEVQVMREKGDATNILRFDRHGGTLWMEHEDQDVLERFFSTMWGPVEWKEP